MGRPRFYFRSFQARKYGPQAPLFKETAVKLLVQKYVPFDKNQLAQCKTSLKKWMELFAMHQVSEGQNL